MPFVIEKSKFKMGLQYLRTLPYSTEVQWEISDLPFVQNKDNQYFSKSSRYLVVELNASTICALLLSERDNMKSLS